MGRIIRVLFLLILIGGLGLLGYAYSGLMQPPSQPVTQPVDLDGS